MDGKNCADRDNPQGSETPGKERRTFRDYNQVGASLRNSPTHRETWSKEVWQLTTAYGFGSMIRKHRVIFKFNYHFGRIGQQPQ